MQTKYITLFKLVYDYNKTAGVYLLYYIIIKHSFNIINLFFLKIDIITEKLNVFS